MALQLHEVIALDRNDRRQFECAFAAEHGQHPSVLDGREECEGTCLQV